MLRLSPDIFRTVVGASFGTTLSAGLFTDHCWLEGKKIAINLTCPLASNTGKHSTDLLASLSVMLGEQKQNIRKNGNLSLTVTDNIAEVLALPWQDNLRSPSELHNYAQIYFEKQGVVINDNWVVHTEFKRYREMGLAYALPRTWVQALAELVESKGMQLKTVLPISAAAYCNVNATKKTAPTLLLLTEETRTTGMVFGDAGLLTYDVEAVAGAEHDSCKRLLLRASANHDNIARIVDWTSTKSEEKRSSSMASALFPKAEIVALPFNVWR